LSDQRVKLDYDLLIIGGGINGTGIARDAAGRGLKVALAEMNDLGEGTSSASTKLFHGGLRYLEYFNFKLVRHALKERETLLQAMPHISWPMRFILPLNTEMRFENTTPASRLINFIFPWMKGRRPAWMIRFGLFLYDHLGGRKFLAGTTSLILNDSPEGAPLQEKYKKAYEYSDCWVDDSRLVVINARDAKIRGADIFVRTKVTAATQTKSHWKVTLQNLRENTTQVFSTKMLINAAGPWVSNVLADTLLKHSGTQIRLVRGSHLVIKKLYDHQKSYVFQGNDGRIIFAIPYETDFTLIGTTDVEHENSNLIPECSTEEQDYLISFANSYFKKAITKADIVWTYSGVRPLYDDGASSATSASRDYVLKIDTIEGAPILNVYGGKITTYRCLAEDVLKAITPFFPNMPNHWTAGVALPGGDFGINDVPCQITNLLSVYSFLSQRWATRLIKAYGTDAFNILANAISKDDLGQDFGATLTEKEVRWLMGYEFARSAEDILWRRSKLGLWMTENQVQNLEDFISQKQKEFSI